MITISSEEFHAFDGLVKQNYNNKVVSYFNEFYPPDPEKTWGYATEQELQTLVLRGMEKSITYGFITEQEQFDFLTCMLELGEQFDNDPNFPWVSAILNDKEGTKRSERLNSALEQQFLILDQI